MRKIFLVTFFIILSLFLFQSKPSFCRKIDRSDPGESAPASKNKAAEKHLKTAHEFWKKGNYKKAVEFSRKAARLDPKNPQIYMFIAWLYIKGSPTFPANPREALPYARRSVELDKFYLPSRFWLGVAYLESGKYEEALSEFKVCDRLTHKNKEQYFQPKFLYAKSRIYAKQNDEKKALEYLRAAIKKNSEFVFLAGSQKDFKSLADNAKFKLLTDYDLYDIPGRKKLKDAIKKAQKDNKRILLHFSANWSKSDKKMIAALKSPDIKKILFKKYHYVIVEVDRFTKNMSIYRQYTTISPYTESVPYITILDKNGKSLDDDTITRLKMDNKGKYSSKQLKEFLERYSK